MYIILAAWGGGSIIKNVMIQLLKTLLTLSLVFTGVKLAWQYYEKTVK